MAEEAAAEEEVEKVEETEDGVTMAESRRTREREEWTAGWRRG